MVLSPPLNQGLTTRVDNGDGDNITNGIHEGDDVGAIGPSLNDLLSSNDLIDYNITNHHRHINERPYLFAPSRTRTSMRDGQVTSQELSPYTRYYSTADLLARPESHGDEYTAPPMRYAPRYFYSSCCTN